MPDLPTLLAALGNTPDEVAETLRKAGVRGTRKLCGWCPVARYLEMQGFKEASVSRYLASTYDDEAHNPDPVSAFINRFDAGRYPDLEES